MPKVKALTALPDGTAKGETKEYSDYEAKILVALKRGVIIKEEEEKVPAPKAVEKVAKKVEKPEGEASKEPAKGTYKTRDLKAE